MARLQARLVRVISDHRVQRSLQAGCNAVLRTDCVDLSRRLYALLRRALRRMHLRLPAGGSWTLYEPLSGREQVEGEAAVPGPLPLLAAGGGGGGAAEPDSGGTPPKDSPLKAQQQQRGSVPGSGEEAPPLIWVGAPLSSPSKRPARPRGSAGASPAGGGKFSSPAGHA